MNTQLMLEQNNMSDPIAEVGAKPYLVVLSPCKTL